MKTRVLWAVSYTHLDVYKRQAGGHPAHLESVTEQGETFRRCERVLSLFLGPAGDGKAVVAALVRRRVVW